MRVKVFKNPPDEKGQYTLDQKRQWYFETDGDSRGQLSLASTVKKFQEYFQTEHCLELSYFDGEEEMVILKDEDLREACGYFINCYRNYDTYAQFVKIYVKEKWKATSVTSTTVKVNPGTTKAAAAFYKASTVSRSASTDPSSSDDTKKLDKLISKVSRVFNTKETQAEVLDKTSIKCMACKTVVKLGKPYNIHNFRKHHGRCQKVSSPGNQSIAALFLAMTAIAERVKTKAKEMIEECERFAKDESFSAANELKQALQKVVEQPSGLDTSAVKIKNLSLNVTEDKSDVLHERFRELCEAGRVELDSEQSSNSSDDNSSDDSKDSI